MSNRKLHKNLSMVLQSTTSLSQKLKILAPLHTPPLLDTHV